MAQKNHLVALVLSWLITAGLVGAGLGWLTTTFKVDWGQLVKTSPTSPNFGADRQQHNRVSQGEKILVTAITNSEKQAGTQAFAAGQWTAAATQFQTALQATPNDPESLIYWNNAKIGNQRAFKIAVSVPIGGNLNVAQEILRGVAQAQHEINQQGGIDGVPLWVTIANDDNNPTVATQIATQFIQDASILAVVGHNSSNVSIATSPVYDEGKLVMISPTSNANKLSGISKYVFRTIPSIRFEADVLARYAIEKIGIVNLAICADSQSQASQSFKEEVTTAMFSLGGRVTSTICDLAAPDFNPELAVSQAISDGADGLFLTPSVDHIPQGIDVAHANQKRLPLLGDSTLYTYKTLQLGQADVNGMVLTVSWHPDAIPNHPFTQTAQRLWGGMVNWRTALAYDATRALIKALSQRPTRKGIQQSLARPDFFAEGATGKIRFLPSGDRNLATTLVKIQPGARSGAGYDFVPLRP